MNNSAYSSKLKGWAVDRVIENAKITNRLLEIEDIILYAKQLVEFCYVESEDVDDIDQRLLALKEEVEYIEAIRMKPASNALDQQEGNA